MRTFERLLLCMICFAPGLAAQSWPVDPAQFHALAQDSTGQTWAIGANQTRGLYRRAGENWQSVAVEGVSDNSQAAALASGPDGAVYCVWTRGQHGNSVTWHRGTISRTLAQFVGELGYLPNIFVDPRLNVWVTGPSIYIYRVTPEGKAECAYTIECDHRPTANLPPNAGLNFPPVYATADGQDRIWFWAGGPGGGGGIRTIDGILIYDGKNFDLHPNIPPLIQPNVPANFPPNTPVGPLRRFAAVEPDDAQHMWVAATRDHLYRVDIQTLLTEAVPEPASNAFRSVQKIFHAGGATYLVAAEGNMPVPERGGEGRIGVLWRFENGQWKRVVNGLDMRPENLMDPPRSFVALPGGIWLGAYGTGPWFIPSGAGEPVHIDWQYGYSLDGSENLTTLADGRLLLATVDGGNTAVKPAELLAAFQSPAGVRTLNPLRALVPDQHGHLWGFLAGDRKVISEWNGKTWTDHVLPGDFDVMRFWNFAVDSQDRIWLLNNRCQGPVTLLYPQRGEVEIYPDLSAALQAQLPHRASFHLEGNFLTVATITPDGRIGYRDPCAQAHYFDGQVWRMWRSRDIDPGGRSNFDGPAFFDRAGNFGLNVAGKTWEFTKDEGWRVTAFERGFGTDPERMAPPAVPPAPPGCEINQPESMVQDRLGTYWLTSKGQLYRTIPGRCVPQFAAALRQPFGDSRTVRTVMIDSEANAFLETRFHAHPDIAEYVVVNAAPPVPHTTVRAAVEASGMVKLRFETSAKGKVWFTWRVDGGEWSPPATTAETTLNWLAEGKHSIEAAALDDRLQIDPTPAVAEVTIEVDSGKQIAALIEQLNDPDYAKRDAAVAALARQPDLALPQLQLAREHANTDQRWWIDAAIQQIKDSPSARKKP